MEDKELRSKVRKRRENQKKNMGILQCYFYWMIVLTIILFAGCFHLYKKVGYLENEISQYKTTGIDLSEASKQQQDISNPEYFPERLVKAVTRFPENFKEEDTAFYHIFTPIPIDSTDGMFRIDIRGLYGIAQSLDVVCVGHPKKNKQEMLFYCESKKKGMLKVGYYLCGGENSGKIVIKFGSTRLVTGFGVFYTGFFNNIEGEYNVIVSKSFDNLEICM